MVRARFLQIKKGWLGWRNIPHNLKYGYLSEGVTDMTLSLVCAMFMY